MKKLKLFALGLLSSGLLLTSCQKDEDEAVGPDISVMVNGAAAQDGKVSVAPGAALAFTWIARQGDVDLQKFEIFQDNNSLANTTNGGNTLPYTNIKASENTTYNDGITLQASANLGTTTYGFVITDEDGLSKRVNIDVVVEAETTPLNTEVVGAFFHIGGSLEGAYDLKNDNQVASSQPNDNKDMMNTDVAGTPFTGSWIAANSTRFVKLPSSYDYEAATVESAAAAYDDGTPTASVIDPDAGEMYVAKLRGNNAYVVIKVTAVNPNDNTCSCGNTGKITFDYRKE